ncbi:PREDICTED: uncharacterized protein LOC109320601 [Crocodylus porosus]|uniref:uncharacterized protein LOC109320601 n=1 Tax=Crocodylus porosus TaxID=8502 RepID=UPI00093EEF55|nr:PREDICTED: uncharacterized protein LOC109320601 [Crocodylus porosus]
MGKLKRKLFGKGKQRNASSGENAPMLSQAMPEKQETHGFQGIKNIAGALLKKAKSEKEDDREKLVATQEPKSSDEAICQVIDQKNFFDACNHIFDLEQSTPVDKAKIDALYNKLEERMWEVVKRAVQSGDGVLLEPLKSVAASLEWQKQKKKEEFDSNNEMEDTSTWRPKYWNKDLENLLIDCMAAQFPSAESAISTDDMALRKHLKRLETTVLPTLECRRAFFKEAGLLTSYRKCCNVCLSSHLTTLTDCDFNFSRCLLVYEWGLKMCKSEKLLQPSWTVEQKVSVEALCLVRIFSDLEEKLLAAAKEEVREALKEAITPRKKLITDTAVVKILTEGTEAVRHISERLRERVEVACLEGFRQFLCSYENEERSLHQPDRPSESCSKLQVFENCIVLRAAWHKLTYIYNTNADMDAKVKESISKIEEEGREYLWKAIAPDVKVTLKNHFRSHDSHLAKFLVPLNSNLLAFEKKGTDSYEMLIRAVHHRIAMEYIQALLTGSRKSRLTQQRPITHRIKQDYETLQDLFVKCLGPEASSGNNPIKVILELNEDTDLEGKKIHLIKLIPLLEKVPHLRKEHLTTILDMEGTLSRADRNNLLNMICESGVLAKSRGNSLSENIRKVAWKCGRCCCFCS